ncbi:hypothetical protein JCM8547_003430 [Rhodosporidiobolus lusitaniae]
MKMPSIAAIWFAHKPFCGANSKPFTFPLLSKDDAEQIEGTLKNLWVDGKGAVKLSDWESAVKAGGYSSKEELIESLTEGSSTSLPFNLRNKALCTARNSLPSAIGGGSLDMQVLYGRK